MTGASARDGEHLKPLTMRASVTSTPLSKYAVRNDMTMSAMKSRSAAKSKSCSALDSLTSKPMRYGTAKAKNTTSTSMAMSQTIFGPRSGCRMPAGSRSASASSMLRWWAYSYIWNRCLICPSRDLATPLRFLALTLGVLAAMRLMRLRNMTRRTARRKRSRGATTSPGKCASPRDCFAAFPRAFTRTCRAAH